MKCEHRRPYRMGKDQRTIKYELVILNKSTPYLVQPLGSYASEEDALDWLLKNKDKLWEGDKIFLTEGKNRKIIREIPYA